MACGDDKQLAHPKNVSPRPSVPDDILGCSLFTSGGALSVKLGLMASALERVSTLPSDGLVNVSRQI